ERGAVIAKNFEDRDFGKGLNEIRALADDANRYFDEKAPWKTLETDPTITKQVLTTTLNVFRMIAIYLKPILPEYAVKVEKLFQEKPYTWEDTRTVLTNHLIAEFEPLAIRIEADKVKAMTEDVKKQFAATTAAQAASAPLPTASAAA